MAYTVSRNGENLGTFTQEGLERQLSNGAVLPTDLAFLEQEQRWVPVSELPKGDAHQMAEFAQQLEVATPKTFVTPVLIGSNVLVFLAMVLSGVPIMEPTSADLIRWGADFGPLTLHGQWWRLLTAAFVHVGLFHIALNMVAFFSAGMFTERLFGNLGFFTLYMLAAIGGNLASVAWQPLTAAAGASGAIFGVYGALIGLLAVQRKTLPPAAVASLGKNAVFFIGYNLIYGLRPGSNIDMAAHLGGLLTGFIAGCALAYQSHPTAGGVRWQRSAALAAAGLLVFVPIARNLHAGDRSQVDAYSIEVNGNQLKVGKDLILYSGTATLEDAQKLAHAMTAIGFLRNRGTLVLYSRAAGGSAVSFVAKEGAWQDPKLTPAFVLLGKRISSVTGNPLKVRLLNKERELKKEFTIE